MKVFVCLFVGLNASSRAIAQSAARRVFPGSAVASLDTLAEALNRERASAMELLVLANPDNAGLTSAVEATDATGLRRWAIVVLGTAPAVEGVEVVSPEEWNEPLLAHVFRSAVAQHQLQRANARLSGDLRTIAHRLSHDLRTPLGGILNISEVLKEVLAEHDPASVKFAKSLSDLVDEQEKLIERVSQVTRATTNRVLKKPVAMEEIIWAVLQRLERQILKNGAVVTQPVSWPEVEATSSWLEIVWWNLLVNVLEHGKEPARIELGWRQNEGEFLFWVWDNGAGVPAERLSTLFQPFHLLHRPDARRGFGLSIVQRLMELQGGTCGYEPRATGGSIFYFTLPAACPATTETSRSGEKAADEFPPSPVTSDPDFRRAT